MTRIVMVMVLALGLCVATAAAQTNGSKKPLDLMNIRGIGEKNFLKLKPLVTVTAAKGESASQ